MSKRWRYGIRKVPQGYVVCEVYETGYHCDTRPFGETKEELVDDLRTMLVDVIEAMAEDDIQTDTSQSPGFWE